MENKDSALFESIIETLPLAVIIVNRIGTVIFVNPAITEITGYVSDEIIGKHFSKLGFLRLQDIPKYTKYFDSILSGQPLPVLEIEFNSKSGEPRWGKGYINVVRQSWNDIRIHILCYDITTEKNLEQRLRFNEDKYSILREATNEGWVEIEQDGTIINVNPTGAKILGYEPDEIIGTSITDYYVHPEERKKLVEQLLKNKFIIDYRLEYKKKDKTTGYVSINGTVAENATNGKQFFITTFRDVTDQTKYHQRLESLLTYAAALGRAHTMDEVAEITKNTITQTIGFNRGSMGLVEDSVLNHKYIWGASAHIILKLPLTGNGVTVSAYKTKQTQLIEDVTKSSEYIDAEGDRATRSELAVPVIIDDEVVAVINIENEKINSFSETDKKLVEIFAEQVASTIQRLTAQKAQIEHLEKFTAFSNAASESFVVLDKEFNIIDINEIGADRFRKKREDIIGKSLFEIQPSLKGSTRHRDYIQIMETGKPKIFDVFSHDTGIEYLRVNAFKVGEGLGIIASDLSELHREQEARAKLNQELFQQQVISDQLIEMDRMKTNLMNTATHEIRTPITSIKGYTELIDNLITDETHPQLTQYLKAISRNVERLEHLSNDLLDMQRIETNRMIIECSNVNLAQLVNGIEQEMSPLLAEKNQRLTTEIQTSEATIFCDEMRIIQVLINLVGNASNYSPKDTEIQLIVTKEAHNYKFTIQDQGIGITETNKPKLFKPFPDIQTDAPRGTGLGLSICKGIIQLHGGEIWAESNGLHRGSTFYFTIPVKE